MRIADLPPLSGQATSESTTVRSVSAPPTVGLEVAVAAAPETRSTSRVGANIARHFASDNVHFLVNLEGQRGQSMSTIEAIATRHGGYGGTTPSLGVVTVPASAAVAARAELEALAPNGVSTLRNLLAGDAAGSLAKQRQTLVDQLQGDDLGGAMTAALELISRPGELSALSPANKTALAIGLGDLVLKLEGVYHHISTGEVSIIAQRAGGEPDWDDLRPQVRHGHPQRPEVLTAFRRFAVDALSVVRELDIPETPLLLGFVQRAFESAALEAITASPDSERAQVGAVLAHLQTQVDQTFTFAANPPHDTAGWGNPNTQRGFTHFAGGYGSIGWFRHDDMPSISDPRPSLSPMIVASRHQLAAEHRANLVAFVLRNEAPMDTMARQWRAHEVETRVRGTLRWALRGIPAEDQAGVEESVREQEAERYDRMPTLYQARIWETVGSFSDGLFGLPPWANRTAYADAAAEALDELMTGCQTRAVFALVVDTILDLAQNAERLGVQSTKLDSLKQRARAAIDAAQAQAPAGALSLVPYFSPPAAPGIQRLTRQIAYLRRV